MYDVPFNNLDGIKLEYSGYTDDWGYNLSASVGEFGGPAFGASIIGENVIILATEASYEWFKIRDVHGSGKTYLDLGASDRTNLQEAAAGLAFMRSVGFTDLEESLQAYGDTEKFLALSIQIDQFDWFINGEVTSIEIEESFLS